MTEGRFGPRCEHVSFPNFGRQIVSAHPHWAGVAG
jgi:hypothetical protein